VPTRRAFLQSTAGLLTPAARKKNVLLLMTDEHRPHALGVDGHPYALTPNLDALARTSVRFDHAYCTSPVCVPSRFSLMTGFYANRGKVHANLNPWPERFKTLGGYFSEAGYATANIGKLHAVSPGSHGFGELKETADWFAAIGPEKAEIWRTETNKKANDGRKGALHVGHASRLPEEYHYESYVARESIRFLEQNRKGPFFLVSSFVKPHDPFTPAERWAKMFPPEKVQVPDTWGKLDLSTVPKHIRQSVEKCPVTPELLDKEQARIRVAMYYANLAQADDRIGAVMGALRDLKLEDDTIVLYLADHGDMVGDKGMWLKFVMYENSVGVPLMMRVPGMTKGGAKCEGVASLVSVVPTLAELCGLDVPAKLDGPSLVPDLRNPSARKGGFAYAEINMDGPNSKQMVRRDDWKYCYNGNDMEQFYNLRDDPNEMTNLALRPEYRQRMDAMREEILIRGQATKPRN
jgi:choline-sulfatase